MQRTRGSHETSVKGDKTLAELAENFSVYPTRSLNGNSNCWCVRQRCLSGRRLCQIRRISRRCTRIWQLALENDCLDGLTERKAMIDRTYPFPIGWQCHLLTLALIRQIGELHVY